MTATREPLGLGPPTSLPAEWTFWADYSDARRAVPPWSGTQNHPPLGPVTLTGWSCTWTLSGYGSAEAVVPVEDNGLSRDDLLRFYSFRLWAFYDNQPVWAGLSTALDDDGGAAVSLALTELPGYLARKQYATTMRYDQVEQTEIAADLAARLENISVAIVQDPGTGFPRDRSYQFLEGESRAELLSNLSEVIGGPEFRCEYDWHQGRPRCTLRIAQQVGRESGLALVVPGGAADFRAHWTADNMRTRTFAVGELPEDAPEDAPKPVEWVYRPQPGIPNLDSADDWPGVILRSTLRERAEANATTYAGPSVELEATQPISEPPITSYGVGDPVSVALADALYPEGYQATGKLTEVSANADEGTAAWTVTVADPPPRPRAGQITGRLGALESRTVGMLRHNLEFIDVGSET